MKKLLALLMAGAMLLSFAACGGNQEEETTVPEETTVENVVNGEEATSGEDATEEEVTEIEVVTDASGEAVTDASGETVTEVVTEKEKATKKEETTKKVETNKPSAEEKTEASSKKPSTPAEVVEYFNKSVNKVKTSAKSVKHTANGIMIQPGSKFPSALNGILKILGGADKFIGDILKDENAKFQAKTYTGADIKKYFPVENESWASKLTAADVSSATCTESGDVYTITIVTKADAASSSVKHGQGHAPKAFNVVLPGVVNDNIPSIAKGMVGLASMSYPASTVTVKVNATTGNVISADYKSYWTINFADAGVVIPFLTTQSFSVSF